jgi:phosphate transport system permease protein
MNLRIRMAANRTFTLLALGSLLLVILALAAILLPILWRGGGAMVFQGTAEFRRMQHEQFGRGDTAAVAAETETVNELRKRAYALYDEFAAGIDTARLQDKARDIYKELGDQLDARGMDRAERQQIRGVAKTARDELLAAMETANRDEALKNLDAAATAAADARLRNTVAEQYVAMVARYRKTVETIDLSRRADYAAPLADIKEAMIDLLGPRFDDARPAVIARQYGATRLDGAQAAMNRILFDNCWVEQGPGLPLRKACIPRDERFAGTKMAELFALFREHGDEMVRPRLTFYWQYLIDGSPENGHFFGGIGPEILGTVIITVLSILFAMPLGVVAAAYLVEVAGDNWVTKMFRLCVNTLAGVPSIVFGLFGLAFFVNWLLPGMGLGARESILAGSLTLALLVLPTMIRASEEAIRAVPMAYREAALSLGASRFRCFVSVTLPAALPGVLTGLILSMGRAAGETAPILWTAGAAFAAIPTSLLQPTRTLSYGSYNMAMVEPNASQAPHNQFGMVMTLVLLVLVLNLGAIILRGRLTRKLSGH